MHGVGGFYNALTLRDLGTGVKMCYPTVTRHEHECIRALKAFVGPDREIKQFYSDREAGLVSACERLTIPHRKSQLGNHQTNTLAERANADILQGSRAVLAQAGLPA